MKRFAMAFALLLGQGPALAQEEAVEEVPAEEVPAVEEVPVEEAPVEEAPVEEVSAEEAGETEAAGEETAYAGEYSGFVDAYYLPTAATGVAGADEYGDGAGGRAQFQFWRFLAASGEYTARKMGDAEEELNDLRLGLGAVARNGSGDSAGLFVEFQRLETDAEELDGPALHGRMSHPVYGWLRFYADIGYLRLESDVEKFSGFEFNAGLLFTYGPAGIFADWRRGQLEGKDTGTRESLEDVRVGARWTFGESAD